jgi:uncharacterized protein YdaU (DUF1376 family)
MAKDPAFLFYTNDFDAKTKFFTHEQVGMYLRLLIAQHQNGHLTEKQMVFVCGAKDEEVFSKFSTDTDGKFFNERLEAEIAKRKSYSDSRKANIAKRYEAKENNTSSTHLATHVETMKTHKDNENENENKGIYPIEKCEKLFFEDFEIHRMAFQENSFTVAELEQAKTEFWNAKKLDAETCAKPYSDTKKHFLNWSRKNKERIKKANTNGKEKRIGKVSESTLRDFINRSDNTSAQ